MKKRVIIFLLSLLIPILSFSEIISYPQKLNDSLIVITPLQLKKTNLIFLEHKKLKLENKELKLQIGKYKQLYNNCLVMDSINSVTINELRDEIIKRDEKIRKQYQYRQRSFVIGGVVIGVLLIILCT